MDDKTNSPVTPPGSPTPPTPPAAPTESPTSTPSSILADLTGGGTAPQVIEEPEHPNTLQNVASGFRTVMGAIFSWVIFPIAVVLILHNFVFQAYHVLGTSMVPTLKETDYLIISKVGHTQALIARMLGQDKKYIPARGQVIVFHYPKDPSKVFVKRVVGVPGDRVVIKGGKVTIFNKDNPAGFNPDTKYEAETVATMIDTDETIEDGYVFVLGDNRTPGGSYDSREWGELPSSYIIGNAVLRLLPLDQVKIL